MKYSESDGKVVFNKDGALGRVIHTTEKVEYVRLTLQNGAEVEPHVLPFASTFFVISGAATLVIDDKTIDVVTGDIVEALPGTSRSVMNHTETAVELLVIKYF